jgi:hypothetical protein
VGERGRERADETKRKSGRNVCHYDGYPEYNGRVLQEHYSHPNQAKALVDNGYQSGLKETIEESNEGRVHKEEPKTYNSIHNFLLDLQGDIEWVYLFTNNEWKVAEVKYIKLPSGELGKQVFAHQRLSPLFGLTSLKIIMPLVISHEI